VMADVEPGKLKQLHGWMEEKIQAVDLAPEDTTVVDDVIGALGTMAAFFVPGFYLAKGTVAVAKIGPQVTKLAQFLSLGACRFFPLR